MAKKHPDDLDKKEGCERGDLGPEGTGVIAMIRRLFRTAIKFVWEIYDYFDLRFSRRVRERKVLQCWDEHGQHSEECKELEEELFPDGGGPSDSPT